MKIHKHFKQFAISFIAACALLVSPVHADEKGGNLPEDPFLLMGAAFNAGDTMALPNGGTATLEKNSDGSLNLILCDAVLESPDTTPAIMTSFPLTITVKGNCTIKADKGVAYIGEDTSATITINEDAQSDSSLTLEGIRYFALGSISVINNCDLTAQLGYSDFFIPFCKESSFTNYGTLSLETNKENEDTTSRYIQFQAFENFGALSIGDAKNYSVEFDSFHQSGKNLTSNAALIFNYLKMTEGTIDVHSSGTAITVEQDFDMTGGEILAIGERTGIRCGNMGTAGTSNITLSGGSIQASAESENGCGMNVEKGILKITGGIYDFQGGTHNDNNISMSTDGAGLFLFKTDTSIENCKITASGLRGIDFEAPLNDKENLTLGKGANLQLKGLQSGLVVYDSNLYIQGGSLQAETLDPKRGYAPVYTYALYFPDTTAEEKEQIGHIILGDNITLTNDVRSSTIQKRETTTTYDQDIIRYFEFFGDENSTVGMKETDSHVFPTFNNIPLKVTYTDSHTHKYSDHGEVIKEATVESEGLIRYYCESCIAYYDQVIPKLSSPAKPEPDNQTPAAPGSSNTSSSTKPATGNVPSTGDASHPVFWLMICGVCTLLLIHSRYKKERL